MSEVQYAVPGMTCGHCVESVTDEIKKVEGVSDVAVDLDTKAVTVTGTNVDDSSVRAAIVTAGYDPNADAPAAEASGGCSCC